MSQEQQSRYSVRKFDRTITPDTGISLTETLFPDSVSPITLHQLEKLPPEMQRSLLRIMLPTDLMVRFGIDPITLRDGEGNLLVHIIRNKSGTAYRFEARHRPDAEDPLAEMEIADTPFGHLEVLWVSSNDPNAPRFPVDIDENGNPTYYGTATRNITAEIAAMRAGLAPGQVRRGLRMFRRMLERMETLLTCLNQREYVAEPLAYHTAIIFERHGFSYLAGEARMRRIHEGFLPGGDLFKQLDGSTPFRQPEMAFTIRGRSWAIHDGILDEPWERVKMIKRVGHNAGVDTFPGGKW